MKSSSFKKLIVLVLLFITIFPLILPTSIHADSVDRRKNLISFAKGKDASSIDSLDSLTYDDLRMLGLFLSNYYIPWSTSVGKSSDSEKVITQMSEALVTTCGYDKDIADKLVRAVFSMSETTAKKLYIANGDVDGNLASETNLIKSDPEYTSLNTDAILADSEAEKKTKPLATLYSFWGCMTGGFDSIGDGRDVEPIYSDWTGDATQYGDDSYFYQWSLSAPKSFTYGVPEKCKGDEYYYMYWEDGDTKRPVWQMDKGTYGNKDIRFTPCTASYLLMMDDANYSRGLAGNAIMSVNEATWDKVSSNLSEREKVKMWKSQMYVDCFGNIICDTGIQSYIVVPACNNPYSWYLNGDTTTVGKYMQLLNFFNIKEAQNNCIYPTSKDVTEDSNGIFSSLSNGGGSFAYKFYAEEDNGLFDFNNFSLARGDDSQAKVDDKWLPWDDDSTFGQDMLDGDFGLDQVAWNEKVRLANFYTFLDSTSSVEAVTGEEDESYRYISLFTNDYKGAFSDMVMIDNYQTFKSSTDDNTSLPTAFMFGKNATNDGFSCICDSSVSCNRFSNLSVDEPDNQVSKLGESAKQWIVSIYLSYLFAYDNATGGEGTKVCYAFNTDGLPKAVDENVDLSGLTVSGNAMLEQIQSMLYYFLHPKEGIAYFSSWFKNKISGVLVGWHEDMVGKSQGTSTTGTTKYIGFTGYVTLPNLSDLSWTAWLLDRYYDIFVYLVILIFLILVTYCVLGTMTFQRAVTGALMFMLVAVFPPLAINASVNLINNACDKLYGDKFTYWALVQHQSYIDELNEANTSDTKSDYLKTIFNNQVEHSSDAYATIKLKWMTPKKDNILSNIANETKDTSSSNSLSLMNKLVKNSISGESFSSDKDALYLYRDYADIYMYQSLAYRCGVNQISPIIDYDMDYTTDTGNREVLYPSGIEMREVLNEISNPSNDNSIAFAQFNGFLTNTTSEVSSSNKSFSYLLDSGVAPSLLKKEKKIKKRLESVSVDDLPEFGIANEKYKLTISNISTGLDIDSTPLSTSKSADQKSLGYFYYGLYTESPFYFFTWNIYDQADSVDFNCGVGATSSGNTIDLYTKNNQSYFFNYSKYAMDGYGELKDFCNMRSLFYYVIPYLKSANNQVVAWDNLYGLSTYSDVKLSYEADNETVKIPNFREKNSDGTDVYSEEYIYKWWHNYNVERLYNAYCPWVDSLYDCSYAGTEDIQVAGDEFTVVDPLDPTSYYTLSPDGTLDKGRYMVFSRSEMKYYGLGLNDLTSVEQHIIKVQDNVYSNLLQLADYYTFNDDVIVTSAGMLTTFEFNSVFSETSILGKNYTLFPQSYELKAFSYDAYLRLILAESTGESVMPEQGSTSSSTGETKSYYQRIVENSSITTGICLVLLDFLAVYAIPALKLFFLIAIFFMSIMMIVSKAVAMELNFAKTVWDALIAPLLKFTLVSVSVAWLVSLFLYNGNTDVTGRKGFSISLGDPTMVLLVMIIINAVVLVLYWIICKKSFSKMISFAKSLGVSIGGAIAGSVEVLAGGLIKGKLSEGTIARGTAKGRGGANSDRENITGSSSNSGGGLLAGGAAGAVLGAKASSSASPDNVEAMRQTSTPKGNSSPKSSSKKENSSNSNKYNEKISKYSEKAKKYRTAEGTVGRDIGLKKGQRKDKALNSASQNYHSNVSSLLDKQKESLLRDSSNRGALGRASSFVQAKKLGVQSRYHGAMGRASNKFYNTKSDIRKSLYSRAGKIRNNSITKTLRIDDASRVLNARRKANYNTSKARIAKSKQSKKVARAKAKGR